ncbi:Hypothetical predicted protein, partial [Pelobates cultripes]
IKDTLEPQFFPLAALVLSLASTVTVSLSGCPVVAEMAITQLDLRIPGTHSAPYSGLSGSPLSQVNILEMPHGFSVSTPILGLR